MTGLETVHSLPNRKSEGPLADSGLKSWIDVPDLSLGRLEEPELTHDQSSSRLK